jgi:hypothetical protein
MGTNVKTCKECGETKELTDFYVSKECKQGVTSKCKVCTRALEKTKRRWTREDRKAFSKAWREANKAYVVAQRKIHYEANKEDIARRKKISREKSKEKIIEYRKKYTIANKEKLALKAKKRNMELPITYVKNKMGFRKDDAIPDVLVEAKRLEMLIKRRVKNENSNNTTQ